MNEIQGETVSKMNPEVKARWVAALRSGKYEQGQQRLQNANGGAMCCLGVLCDIVDPSGWAPRQRFGLAYRENVDLPPMEIRAAAGFPEDGDYYSIPEVDINGVFHALWAHNDSGRTFAEIADAIEAQL